MAKIWPQLKSPLRIWSARRSHTTMCKLTVRGIKDLFLFQDCRKDQDVNKRCHGIHQLDVARAVEF